VAAQRCLGDLREGSRACVAGYSGASRPYLRRLLAMGLIPGAEFTIVRRAPLGDPIEIELLGFRLSLRADEAAAIRIEAVEP
jgi:ferrous iron transport protein A